MNIQSYEEWKPLQPEIKCRSCDGYGDYVCDEGGYLECDYCKGDGVIIKNNMNDYFHTVVADIRSLCIWTRGDFLAAVGPFVRTSRGFDRNAHGKTDHE